MIPFVVVKVELRVTSLRAIVVPRPAGNDDEARLIVSANPLNPVREMIAVPVVPAARLMNMGLALMVKVGAITSTVTNTFLAIVPADPVTIIV